MLDALVLIVFPLLMVFACLYDLLTEMIPNRISILLFGGFCLLAALLQISWREFGFHIAGGFVFLSLAFTLFSMGWIGGGDGKLAASTALWLGLPQLLEFAVTVSILGGLLAMVLVVFRRFPLPNALVQINWVVRLHKEDGAVPYGIAIGLAGLLLYPQSTIWVSYMESVIR